ncbi:MotE family protein [Azospirillum sp. B4]|uniref:MotE family protein n=1 Tax=Azospirillum sp. B4 TaxID=95605 RepID=UPI00034AA05E|nr:MotE family protein [Azospirillum sp. B4]
MTAEPTVPRQGRPNVAVSKAAAPAVPNTARTLRPAPAGTRAAAAKATPRGGRGGKDEGPKPPLWRRARLRLLPVTIFAAVLLLGARATDMWWTLTVGAAPPEVPAARAQAPAQEKPAATPAPATPGHAPAGAPVAKPAEGAAKGEAKGEGTKPEPSGSPTDGQSFTPKDVELLQRLAERREALDSRERDLDQREAMLQVATQRLDQKLAEMQALKKQLDGLVNQVNADQAQQLDSLVKIYETMKPAEAARIFEAMDDKVLLNVISRMKEAKAAPVLAAMTPKRAEQVTTMLADRKRLPSVPQ